VKVAFLLLLGMVLTIAFAIAKEPRASCPGRSRHTVRRTGVQRARIPYRQDAYESLVD
jgi:hypothetical protein